MNEDDKQRMMMEYIEEKQPNNPLSHALAFAYLKGKLEITQKQYAETVEVSARTLRGYISDNRVAYEKELKRAVDEVKAGRPEALAGRLLTEDQLDVFVESLVNAAINPKASVRDRQLLIDLLGVDGKRLLELQDTKRTTLRWWIKGNISTLFRKGLDTREIGIMLETSDLLKREDDKKSENIQNYLDKDITDEGFKLELMLFGMLFINLYDEVEHPDTDVLAAAVRLDRVLKGTQQNTDSRGLLSHYTKGEDKQYKKPEVMTDERYFEMLKEICDTEAEYEKEKADYIKAKRIVTPPKINAKNVKQRETKHKEELEIFTTLEEQTRNLLGMDQK